MSNVLIPPKNHNEPSVFFPENLLREARRQKSLPHKSVPEICLLDPDGDIVRFLVSTNQGSKDPSWACYHTDLYIFEHGGFQFGVVGCAVGASFAVLIAEELFASNCQLLVSITSAGQITATRNPPYFILIDKALRDEGTSHHYLPPSDYSNIDERLLTRFANSFVTSSIPVTIGATWTTDAPFRETESAINHSRTLGILAVEMEASALYAFAQAKHKPVICLAHVTNQMASIEGDFEKGIANGSQDALQLLAAIANIWHNDANSNPKAG